MRFGVLLSLISSLLCFDAAAVETLEERAAEVSVSDLVNLSDVCDAPSCEEGTHGGTQSRICRTSHGSYVAFLGRDAAKKAVVHAIRIRDGRVERLFTKPTSVAGSNSVHVVADADEDVYVLAAGNAFLDRAERATLKIHQIDRSTGEAVEHKATIPFGRGSSYGYSSVCLDAPRRAVYALYSGGDAPGYFAWFRFDLAEMRWDDRAVVADLAYRHCYNYASMKEDGGMSIVSERDVLNKTVGLTPEDTQRRNGTRYVWDELRLFDFPDVAKPEYTAVDVETAVYDREAGLYPNVQNNFNGDAFVDAEGRTHVLYRSIDNNRIRGGFNRHAVFDARNECISNELLPFQNASAIRMAQSSEGRHFLLVMPQGETARVQVWRAADADGLRYELLTEKRLSDDVKPSYAGLAVSCPRNGSIQDDRIDCLFPVRHSYYHFRVDLKQ